MPSFFTQPPFSPLKKECNCPDTSGKKVPNPLTLSEMLLLGNKRHDLICNSTPVSFLTFLTISHIFVSFNTVSFLPTPLPSGASPLFSRSNCMTFRWSEFLNLCCNRRNILTATPSEGSPVIWGTFRLWGCFFVCVFYFLHREFTVSPQAHPDECGNYLRTLGSELPYTLLQGDKDSPVHAASLET